MNNARIAAPARTRATDDLVLDLFKSSAQRVRRRIVRTRRVIHDRVAARPTTDESSKTMSRSELLKVIATPVGVSK